jgi:hypothetical protein
MMFSRRSYTPFHNSQKIGLYDEVSKQNFAGLVPLLNWEMAGSAGKHGREASKPR